MLLKDFDTMVAFGKKGDWYFSDNYKKIGIMWGDDWFTDLVILPINKINENNHNGISWIWNGDINNPTLSPSILVSGTDKVQLWHGFLQDGELINA